MLRQFIPALLIVSIISCKNNSHSIETPKTVALDTTARILIYGLLDRQKMQAMNTVAKEYGFTYHAVAGCVVSKELLDSVNKENQRVYALLAQRFGNNWRPSFAEKVDKMQRLQEEAEALVKKESYILKKQSELEKVGNALDYFIDPADGQNTFTVKVYSWTEVNGESKPVVYYHLTVDLIKKTL